MCSRITRCPAGLSCPALEIANSLASQCSRSHGHTCSVVCTDQTYPSQVPALLRCSNGEWIGDIPTCDGELAAPPAQNTLTLLAACQIDEQCVAPANSRGVAVCQADKTCSMVCENAFADCDNDLSNGCESQVMRDSNNCGACGTQCLAHQICSNGVCACELRTTNCVAVCADAALMQPLATALFPASTAAAARTTSASAQQGQHNHTARRRVRAAAWRCALPCCIPTRVRLLVRRPRGVPRQSLRVWSLHCHPKARAGAPTCLSVEASHGY